jgi:hypothetical protein
MADALVLVGLGMSSALAAEWPRCASPLAGALRSSGESASHLDLLLKLVGRQMDVAFTADRDQHVAVE